MRKFSVMGIILLSIFIIGIKYGHTQCASVNQAVAVKTVDINKDNKPDIIYYSHDNKYVSKAEADTNFDEKTDITMYLKEGKFDSAEVDTNHDGKIDKKFSDLADFNKWLNENNPNFHNHFNNPDDWQFSIEHDKML
ncbi:MAG: hypothetical protein AB1755_04440 [Candidatus Omnitrophota bacterium]